MSLSTPVVFGAFYFFVVASTAALSSSPSSSPSSKRVFHRIEIGGSIPPPLAKTFSSSSTSSEELLRLLQTHRRTPPNTRHPSYHHPAGFGGTPHSSGSDGLVVLSVSSPPEDEPVSEPDLPEIPLFRLQGLPAEQTYQIPGNPHRRRLVTVRAWGAGGGGCSAGTEAVDDDNDNDDAFGAGRGGSYVEASFRLLAGDVLTVVVGAGGGGAGDADDPFGSNTSSTSLGGKGGYPRGEDGRSDRFAGGGGDGGATTVSLLNGTLLLAAFGGDGGGGSTAHCSARGGRGGVVVSGDGIRADAGGYLDFGRVYVPSEREAMGPGVPATTDLYHDRASFTWNAGADAHWTSQETYIHEYVVSLATTAAECPDQRDPSYRILDTIPRNIDVTRNSTTAVSGLDANTSYCFLVRAFSKDGIDLGNRILPFRTKPEPVNEWISVPIREDEPNLPFEAKYGNGVNGDDDDNENNNGNTDNVYEHDWDWSWCEHSATRPTGRRGHSLTAVDNQVYVFGGVTLKCLCETIDAPTGNREKRCSSRNVHSDELFHFDPVTATFTLLETTHDHERPKGREQHSATALANGNILVVGGITSYSLQEAPSIGEDPSQQYLLADVWQLSNPHRVTTVETRATTHHDDPTTSWPLELIPGQITRHVITLDDEDSNDVEKERMCVEDVRVRISMEHSCPSAMEYIALAGPRTRSGSIDGFDFLPPQSYYYDVQLYASSADNLQSPCHPETLNLFFSDHEPESILSRSRIPTDGEFRPASELAARFRGIPLDDDDGPWELSIAQRSPTQNEHITGTLLDWQLILDVTPCEAKAKWKQLPSPPASFAPRRLHSSIAVGDSLFVSGGFGRVHGSGADRPLVDLWRLDYDSDFVSFIELRASPRDKPMTMYGQVALLGPFGLLGYGGVRSRGPRPQGKDLWLGDIFENDWVSVPVEHGGDAAALLVNDKIPYGRYLSSIGLLDSEILRQIYNIDGPWPTAMTFGGDGSFLHNGYNDDYGFTTNSLFDDVWILSAGAIATNSSVQNQRRRDHCHWRQLPTSTSVRIWNDTCGWNDSGSASTRGICRWDEILIRAWCLGQYQSFYLS